MMPACRRVDGNPPGRTLFAIGSAGGLFGALVGGGTGSISIPALDRLSIMPRALAHGTVATPNAVVAAVGAGVYGLSGRAIDSSTAIPMMLGGVLGVQLGAMILRKAPEKILRAVFVTVLVIAGIKLAFDGAGVALLATGSLLGPSMPQIVLWGCALVLGIAVGAWSAALGLGGGLLTVPALVVLFGVPMHTALGTSLLVMLPNAALSILAHHRQGTASTRIGARLAVGAAPGAAVGALLALALPAHVVSFAFGIFTLTIATLEITRSCRPISRSRRGPHRVP